MIRALFLLTLLSTPPEIPKETIAGVLGFDVLYNGLRVGIFGEGSFLTGFKKGALLGMCQFGAKLIDAKQQTNYAHLPLRMAHSVCNSMTDNLMFKKDLLKQIDFSIGVGTYHYVRGERDYFSISPGSVGVLIEAAAKGAIFDWKNSLLLGMPVFSDDNGYCQEWAAGCYVYGVLLHRKTTPEWYKQTVTNHELNHAFVYESFQHIDRAIDTLIPFRPLLYIEVYREIMPVLNFLPYEYRPHEVEAYTLTRHR